MTEREINFLRSKCQSLEIQTKQLELTKSHLQSQLTAVQASLINCDDKDKRVAKIPTKTPTCCRIHNADRINQIYLQKLDTATKLLKLR